MQTKCDNWETLIILLLNRNFVICHIHYASRLPDLCVQLLWSVCICVAADTIRNAYTLYAYYAVTSSNKKAKNWLLVEWVGYTVKPEADTMMPILFYVHTAYSMYSSGTDQRPTNEKQNNKNTREETNDDYPQHFAIYSFVAVLFCCRTMNVFFFVFISAFCVAFDKQNGVQKNYNANEQIN